MDGLNTMTIQSILLEHISIFKEALRKYTAESNRLVALGGILIL